MRNNVALITATLVLVITLSSVGMNCGPSEPPQFLTYTDEASGFSIDYPEGWSVEHLTEHWARKVSITTQTWTNKAVTIMVYKDGATKSSLENFSESHIQSAHDNSEDYVSISTDELTINRISAMKHIFDRTISSTSCTSMMICLVENEIGWTLFLDSPKKSFDSYKSTFDTVLNSFRLLK